MNQGRAIEVIGSINKFHIDMKNKSVQKKKKQKKKKYEMKKFVS